MNHWFLKILESFYLKLVTFVIIKYLSIMTEFIYSLGSFFEYIFGFMPLFGDYINYLYIFIISAFLIIWVMKMMKFKKMGNE